MAMKHTEDKFLEFAIPKVNKTEGKNATNSTEQKPIKKKDAKTFMVTMPPGLKALANVNYTAMAQTESDNMVVHLNDLKRQRKDLVDRISNLEPPKVPVSDSKSKIVVEELETGSVKKNITVT